MASSRRRSLLAFVIVAALGAPAAPSVAARTAGPSGAAGPKYPAPTSADTFGIPVVTRIAQGSPTNEQQAQAFSDALVFAEEHPDDVGYPWIDPKTEGLELSAASIRGRDLLAAERMSDAGVAKVRDVSRSFGELEAIKHEITTLRMNGVPDAEYLFKSTPDHRDNRIVIGVTRPSEKLFKALSDLYGTQAIAILVDPDGGGVSTGATRQTDFSPYWGGAHISTPSWNCSDAFSWRISAVGGDAMLTAAHCISTGGSVSIGQQTNSGTVQSQAHENWSDTLGTRYYTGDNAYRGDVALIRLSSNRSSDPYIYRGGKNSSNFAPVVSYYQRNSLRNDVVYVGGAASGETGPYTVSEIGTDQVYDPPSDIWARNVTVALRGAVAPCAGDGDSGGSVFSLASGGVKAAGVFSGFIACRIYFTDIYRSYVWLPGGPIVN